MIKEISSRIWVTFTREGIHNYPAASQYNSGGWDDVSFLAYPHRHIFFFRVEIDVYHNDREIEFIQFKRWLNSLFSEGVLQLDFKSCEMIADDVAEKIKEKYPDRSFSISIAEDNESGCIKQYN